MHACMSIELCLYQTWGQRRQECENKDTLPTYIVRVIAEHQKQTASKKLA